MANKKQRKSKRSRAETPTAVDRTAGRRRWLLLPVLGLLGAATGSNIYLGHLFVRVKQAATLESVQSFCRINQQLDCVTVADSPYAAVLGVPVAFWGAEYFGLLTLLVLASALGLRRLRSWDSLVFWGMLVALPVSLLMGYISLVEIQSVCLLCSVVYGANIVILLLLLLAYAKELSHLLRGGPRELLAILGRGPVQTVSALIVLAGLSQLLWVPQLIGVASPETRLPRHDMFDGLEINGVRLGPDSAPVVIDEFTDFQCPHCSRAHRTLLELAQRFPKRVQLRHYDYPLCMECNRKVKRRFHPLACRAAYYARCAAQQQRFWPYAALLFTNQHVLRREHDLRRLARQADLDSAKLASCAAGPQVRREIERDIEEGIRRGVMGTPTFFINSRKVVGPRPLRWWEHRVESLLGGSRASGRPKAAPASRATPHR